jgi:serine/threonine protein phosphatase PrpC
MNYISDTFKGEAREINKDKIVIFDRDNFTLFLVFDGVSSSENALDAINTYSKFVEENIDSYLDGAHADISALLFEANKYLTQNQENDGSSTLVAVFIDKRNEENNRYVSLGDTRIYNVSNQSLDKITIDDNPINTPNVVTRYVGMLEFNHRDFADKKLSDFYRLIICTDGFYNLLSEELITFHKILNFKKLGNVKNALSDKISGRNADDASYVVIEQHVPNRARFSN